MLRKTPLAAVLIFASLGAIPARADKPTPARHVQTRPGFTVERVLQVGPREGANLGSWVAMCFDDKGRIYASAEGKQGLFRVTPPALPNDEEFKVERISDKWGHCQGMAWINGSLYVVQHERPQHGNFAEKDLLPNAVVSGNSVTTKIADAQPVGGGRGYENWTI